MKQAKINEARRLLSGRPPQRPPQTWIIRNGKATAPGYPEGVQRQDYVIFIEREIIRQHENTN